jgi:GWxTD domain-containing protein
MTTAITDWNFLSMGCINALIFRSIPLKILICAIALAAPVTVAYGQSPTTESSTGKPLAVYSSAVVFNNPEFDSVSEVEFPFTLNRCDFAFYRADSLDANYYSNIFARVVLLNSAGLPADSAQTYFTVRVATKEETLLPDIMLFNKLFLPVKAGVYSARLTVIDAVSKKSEDVFIPPFSVAAPRHDRLYIGGPAMAYRINYLTDTLAPHNSRMVRNRYVVLNNPLGVYDNRDSLACVYLELYNLKYDSTAPSKFQVAYAVLDASHSIFRDFGRRTADKPGSSAALADVLDITNWPDGQYTVRIIATDLGSREEDTSSAPLRIVSREGITKALAAAPTGDVYDSLSLQERLNLVTFALTPPEKATLSGLTDSGKVRFLEQFWKEHDGTPGTKVNEYRADLIARYKFCVDNFSTDALKKDGWKTDRGRIYLTYGPWDEKNEVTAPRYGNPFTIWYYRSIKEGLVFVFEDQEGYHDMRLVHSNAKGETYSKDWAARLQDEMLDVY